MTTKATAAALLREALLHRITGGYYSTGGRLPACRDLAREFRVHRNTVSRVYQQLAEEGYILPQVGRGTIVLRQPGELPGSHMVREKRLEGLREELLKAKLTGMPPEVIRRLMEEAFASVFPRVESGLAFVECTAADTRQVAVLLSHLMGTTVEPLVLDDLVKDPALASRVPLIATTFYHLSEVLELVGDERRVVGLQHDPAPDSVLRIARLPRGTSVAVVAPNSRTSERLSNIAAGYGLNVVLKALPEEVTPADLATAGVSAIIDIHSSHSRASARYGAIPSITVDFTIAPQSLAFLRQRWAQLVGQPARTN